MPFGRGTTLLRALTNHGYQSLTKWDDPPSRVQYFQGPTGYSISFRGSETTLKSGILDNPNEGFVGDGSCPKHLPYIHEKTKEDFLLTVNRGLGNTTPNIHVWKIMYTQRIPIGSGTLLRSTPRGCPYNISYKYVTVYHDYISSTPSYQSGKVV